MINFDYEYLDSEQLAGFDKYKYNCKDTGLLSIYVMHPFWNWVVEFCPKKVAPNLLTFSGFAFTVITTVMFMIMDYYFYASDEEHPEFPPLPRWAFMLAAIFIFLAYTLDGIDGKQARKTGTSGPLGELFDHGLDSYSAGLIPLTVYSIFGRGDLYSLGVYRFYFMMCNILLNFYSPHFEKYNTGLLFLPWGYDFSMWGTIIVFAITGVVGHEFWQFRLENGIKTATIFELTIYGSALLTNVPIIAYNIYKSYKEKTGYMRTFSEAIRPLVPVTILFVICTIWVLLSPTRILERDPRMIYLILGTIFSNICCRLIVSQMSSSRCDIFNWLFIPLLLVVVSSLFVKIAFLELILTYILCAFVTAAHIHYGTCLVRQMCRHFDINCFSIKNKN
ncbi:ethanolaminephosphotransferase 1-like isoform X1 [Coccinella septempunctata]|uniref:ethanolaminephosphotransferase 1-like isoform X1 n=2 Tax=Coccinella septempunctata TaxID=41139 RepID=UPI001D094991|nr:ethanolaminephosphotransferase 1-like isoform X1 [Coccinella septempunctata]